MTIQDWGAVGEIIGALAVIFSLVYLIVQVRQHAKGINAATVQQSLSSLAQINTVLAANADLAEIYQRGTRDPDLLNEKEKLNFYWLSRSYVTIYDTMFQQYLAGTCPEKIWFRYAGQLKALEDAPGFQMFKASAPSHIELYKYIENLPKEKAVNFNFGMVGKNKSIG